MATVIPSSSSSPSERDSPFRVTTREVSADFSTVGPDQSPNELGALSESAFRALIEKFASIPPVKLIDGDPQLVVATKRGRFFVLPSNGKLLLRSANDPQQPYLKFEPAELPAFLQGSDLLGATDTPPRKHAQTLIGSAADVPTERAATIPPSPAAPIYGSFPERRATPPTSGVVEAPPAPSRPVAQRRPRLDRNLVIGVSLLFLAFASGSLWILFGPTKPPKPLPPGPPTEFEPIRVSDQLVSLKKRTLGTYATSGESGERLLEIREDGTFHYQVFGSSLARTINRKGTYTFAQRHGTDDIVLRTNGLGTIEVRDEKHLSFEQVVFTRLP
jgi:hypothetical protein